MYFFLFWGGEGGDKTETIEDQPLDPLLTEMRRYLGFLTEMEFCIF